MAEAIPASELLDIPNGSHTAPIETPHLVDQVIRDFLQRRIDGAGAEPVVKSKHDVSQLE
jgi:hypothetical protein